MYCIGESLNVISTKIGRAYKERDPKPIQEEALFQRKQGMDWIDINLGPAKKDGHELMPWVVKTVQEVVDDVPLALDTSNIDAIEAALKVIKPIGDDKPHLINSIMCRPERYEKMIPIAAESGADFIALLWGPEGLPRDENERAALCVELLYAANEAGIPNEKIWVDGIVTPRQHSAAAVDQPDEFHGHAARYRAGCQERLRTFQHLQRTSGSPASDPEPDLHDHAGKGRHVLRHFRSSGRETDRDRQGQASGHRGDWFTRLRTAKHPPIAELDKEMQDYVKTVDVILGRTLYSDSWLEV